MPMSLCIFLDGRDASREIRTIESSDIPFQFKSNNKYFALHNNKN
jgi:hypothetical protein